MKKTILTLTLLAALVAGYTFAQEFGRPNSDIGQSIQRDFVRTIKLNAARTDQLNAIWEIIDAKKPNITLLRVMLTRDGTNDVTITVSEAIRVKLVED